MLKGNPKNLSFLENCIFLKELVVLYFLKPVMFFVKKKKNEENFRNLYYH